MALDEIEDRLQRITKAFDDADVPYALIGGQAVAIWVASKDPAAVRTTKDVEVLLRRQDVPTARAAAKSAGFDYFEVVAVGMFLERSDPNPKKGVLVVWTDEKDKPDYPLPSPSIDNRVSVGARRSVISLPSLVRMKLMANRDHDRAQLRDMIDVGLVDRTFLDGLPDELAARLDFLLNDIDG